MKDAEYDNDGSGRCPVWECGGWVDGGKCEKCGEDFSGPEWQEDREHVIDGSDCWCNPRVVHVPPRPKVLAFPSHA